MIYVYRNLYQRSSLLILKALNAKTSVLLSPTLFLFNYEIASEILCARDYCGTIQNLSSTKNKIKAVDILHIFKKINKTKQTLLQTKCQNPV